MTVFVGVPRLNAFAIFKIEVLLVVVVLRNLTCLILQILEAGKNNKLQERWVKVSQEV